MPDHVMSEPDAVAIIDALAARGVAACVGGGWGVDALLGQQTRVHADLDLWLLSSRFDIAVEVFVGVGVDRLYPWGDDRPWNLVLHDSTRRRVDLHLYEVTRNGTVHYGGFETGETFPGAALHGRGTIDGRAVLCEAPEWSLRWHTGYPPRPQDRHDVHQLCDRFDLPVPPEFR